MLIVTLFVPSSSAGPPEVPGSVPVLPESLTVTVNVALALGVSEPFRYVLEKGQIHERRV